MKKINSKEEIIRNKRAKSETGGENLCRKLVRLADQYIREIDYVTGGTTYFSDNDRMFVAGKLQQAAEELLKAYIVSKNEEVKHFLQTGTYYRKCLKLNNEFSKIGRNLRLLRDYSGDYEYDFRRKLSGYELHQIVMEMKELYFFEEIANVRKKYINVEKYGNYTKIHFERLSEKAIKEA